MNITRFDSLGKYLGCPAFQGKPKASLFQDLLARTMTKLAGWKTHYLSKVGRTVLIQSHLEALPAHTMQCFSLPQSISKGLNRHARDFF